MDAVSESGGVTTEQAVLVHLAAGIGNIVLATPLLIALHELGYAVDVLLHADYPQTRELLTDWDVVRTVFERQPSEHTEYAYRIPAIPPFYWQSFARDYRTLHNVLPRPADALFYADEQCYYLNFAKQLGYPTARRPAYRLPIGPVEDWGVTARSVVLAPGCKSGEMACKRWPYFTELAEALTDVVVVGTGDDLRTADGTPLRFPAHTRLFVDRLDLRQTAELMAAAGAVVGNDSGLSHVAAAVGTPTWMIFGPTPHRTLGELPPHARVLRSGLDCEPCWFTTRFQACNRQLSCLWQLPVETVAAQLQAMLGIELRVVLKR